jgi:hypothetical protein
MPRRALVLVEGNTHGPGLQYVQTARRLGLHPVTLSADPAQYEYLAAEGFEAARVDTKNLDALLWEFSRLRATYDIAGVTSAEEQFYATVGKLCRYFGLQGPNPASIELCCDKLIQRQLLEKASVPIPAYRMATNATEVESAAAEIGLPVVVKPAVGTGSCGVRLCRDVDELIEHTTYLLGGKHLWRSSPMILVEEFARGRYYCAETMGYDIIGIGTAEFGGPPYFAFREFAHPAPLTDDEQKRIADVSLSCLRALGLGWGPTNVEFRWTERGPVVIEVNPRLGGGTGPRVVQLAYGIDLGCAPRGARGFPIYRPEHWAFADTGLFYGDVLGAESHIFGYEVDGLDYTMRDGLPYPTSTSNAPEGLEILSVGMAAQAEWSADIAPEAFAMGESEVQEAAEMLFGEASSANIEKLKRGNGMMVNFKRGKGEVFHAGSCEWVAGLLRNDAMVEQVTRNVLTRYLGRS